MMHCPKCKAEIDSDSFYCDQCGQEIRFCQSCRKSGKGNRCTACGGRMVPAAEYAKSSTPYVTGNTAVAYGDRNGNQEAVAPLAGDVATMKAPATVRLILSNGLMGITIEGVDGAVIGRRQGIYCAQFSRFPYVSGTHAQLKFDSIQNRWTITDMNSSNGTKYNGTSLVPGMPCVLENGATVQLANVMLTVAVM